MTRSFCRHIRDMYSRGRSPHLTIFMEGNSLRNLRRISHSCPQSLLKAVTFQSSEVARKSRFKERAIRSTHLHAYINARSECHPHSRDESRASRSFSSLDMLEGRDLKVFRYLTGLLPSQPSFGIWWRDVPSHPSQVLLKPQPYF